MSSDGTPLEAIESGEIANAADSSRMQAILRDMGAPGQDVPRQPEQIDPNARQYAGEAQQQQQQRPPQMTPQMIQQMQMMKQQQMQQQMQQQQMLQQRQYAEGEQGEEQAEQKGEMKKNIWSSVLEQIRDPLFTALIFFLLSLPVLHTFLAKNVEWAFAVGGQLSWAGLFALSLVSGILMALLRMGSSIAGF